MQQMDGNKKKHINRREFIQIGAISSMMIPILYSNYSAIPETSLERPLCIFSKHLQFLDYDNMAKAAADAGFNGVDLSVRPGGHVLPENAVSDFPKAVEAVKKAGLEVYMMTTRITDPQDKFTLPILQTADKLGVRFYRMGYLRYDENIGVMESLQKMKPSMQQLAELNKRYNIHGAYQNHSGTRVGGAVWDVYELIKDLDPRWMGVQYDIRHAVVEGATAWPVVMKLLKNFIKITAIKDFYWAKGDGKWTLQNCPLGEGMVDFKRYFDLVKEYELSGPISMHFEYELPGENDTSMTIAERTKKTVQVMKKDVEKLQNLLKQSDL